jgi:ATP-dependent Lon protease
MFNLNKKKLVDMSEEFDFPLLPLRDVVVFPNMVVPLFVGRD